MSGERPQYRPGDVVNGHMLGADGRWVPIAQPATERGEHHEASGAPAQYYRPGDVVNGYVLNARYQWEPVVTGEDAAAKQRPPGPLAVGLGVAGFIPFFGGLCAVIAVVLGGRIVTGRSGDTNRDLVLGVVAMVLGVIALLWQIRVY